MIDPVTEANPDLKIETATFDSNEEAAAKLAGGFQADVVEVCADEMQPLLDQDLIRPLDPKGITSWDDLAFTNADGIVLDGKQYGVPLSAGLEGLVYNTEEVPGGIDELTDLWDPQFAGRSTIQGSYALPPIGRGGAGDRDQGPDGHGRRASSSETKQYLIDHADQFRTLWGSDSDLVNLFKSGEVVVAAAGPQLAQRIIDGGVPAKWAYAKDGTLSWVCGFALTSNAQNIRAAYALMNWQSSPEAQAIRAQRRLPGHEQEGDRARAARLRGDVRRRLRRPGDPRDPSARLPGVGAGVPRLQVAVGVTSSARHSEKGERTQMTATPFTRREALKNGVLGVASLTIAERLLAYGGQNEALAAMKPTLAKNGLRAARVQEGPAARPAEGLSSTSASTAPGRRCPTACRCPPATTAPATSRAAATRSGSSATRRASSRAARTGRVNAYDPIAQGGVTVSHFNTRTGKVLGNALVLNGTDNNCNGGVTPVGHLADAARRTRSARSRATAPSTATCSRSRARANSIDRAASRSRRWAASSTRPARSTRRPGSST